MVTIDLRLFATLADRAPTGSQQYGIEAGITIAQLLEKIRISPQDAKLVFVDGLRADFEKQLFGGERVGIFPPVGGG